jgi:hypothetical protein
MHMYTKKIEGVAIDVLRSMMTRKRKKKEKEWASKMKTLLVGKHFRIYRRKSK